MSAEENKKLLTELGMHERESGVWCAYLGGLTITPERVISHTREETLDYIEQQVDWFEGQAPFKVVAIRKKINAMRKAE